MNNNDMLFGGMPNVPNIGKPKVDPRDYPTVKCHKCGSIVFNNAVILKEIPGAVVGQGAEPIIAPLQILVCNKCGEILKADVEAYKLEKELEDETKVVTDSPVHVENNNDSIIIG